tara:strand:- start:720 stop:920 length:201 start_codon:yes stop_codon:yes gene_type:complete
MDQQLIDFKNYVNKDKERIQHAVDVFDEEPHFVRNYIAEQGLEYTPDQLAKMIELIRNALEDIDNE